MKKKVVSMFPAFGEELSSPLDLPKFVVETNKFAIGFVKDILGVIYGDRHYARFAALETIARVPYFSCKLDPYFFLVVESLNIFYLHCIHLITALNIIDTHRYISSSLIRNLRLVPAKGVYQITFCGDLE